jgi:hypothetical protein
MVTWSLAGGARARWLGPLFGFAAALAGACGGGKKTQYIACTTQEHCTPYGLECDLSVGVCKAPGAGGSFNAGGSDNAGGSLNTAGSDNSGGFVSTGGSVGSGGLGNTAGSDNSGGFVSTGGSVGSGGSGNTGGTVNVAGSNGSGGTANPPLRTLITPSYGYVDSSTNDVGISGWWFTYSDALTTISPTDFLGTPSTICVSGAVPNYANPDLYWGAGAAMNLNQASSAQFGSNYNASAHGVVGFQFSLTGTPPLSTRVHLKQTGSSETYCAPAHSGLNTVLFSDVTLDCWLQIPYPVEPSSLESCAIQIVTGEDIPAHSYSFCIENLRAILQ